MEATIADFIPYKFVFVSTISYNSLVLLPIKKKQFSSVDPLRVVFQLLFFVCEFFVGVVR